MFHIFPHPEHFRPNIDGDIDLTSVDICSLTTRDISRIRNTWIHPLFFTAVEQWNEVRNEPEGPIRGAVLLILMTAVASFTRPMTEDEIHEIRQLQDEHEKESAQWEDGVKRAAIADRIKRVPFHELNAIDNRIIRYIVMGLSYREIGLLVTLSASAVRKRAVKYTRLIEQCLAMSIGGEQ